MLFRSGVKLVPFNQSNTGVDFTEFMFLADTIKSINATFFQYKFSLSVKLCLKNTLTMTKQRAKSS